MDTSREELGNFLRSRRERLQPKNALLASGRRRRTPGLRREEVAELAGIGVDWYIRLEQGRDVSPSAATVDALARALSLSKVEHAHLRVLAKSGGRRLYERERVPTTLQRILDGLSQPAYITGRRWDVLAWNAATAEAIIDYGRFAEADRNVMLYVFLDPDAKRLFGSGWANEAKRLVGLYRTTYDQWAADPSFAELTQRLLQGSRDFARWWQTHDIGETRSGRKTLYHPKRGAQVFDYASFQANDDPGLKLVIYTLRDEE